MIQQIAEYEIHMPISEFLYTSNYHPERKFKRTSMFTTAFKEESI